MQMHNNLRYNLGLWNKLFTLQTESLCNFNFYLPGFDEIFLAEGSKFPVSPNLKMASSLTTGASSNWDSTGLGS